ncbi:DUF2336 domain-containing protein [Bosea sp. (in: a-proteobacteria)]|uniref:DUF2336 domain-containing protein n=1 Tax=Bosea sp. (in: a-proteobacteria) TaxID=1871050 RepID=UPI002FCC62B3
MIVRRFLLWARTAPAEARAAGAAALAGAYLRSEMSPEDRREAETALIFLVDDPSPLVRRALAEEFAGASGAPRTLVLGLIAEPSDAAALLLAQSPVLGEADLVDAAAIGDGLAQRAIAQRPHLPASVAAALAEVGVEEALLALLGNPTADIPEFSLARIFEREGESGAVREALLARLDLPAGLRQSIAGKVSDALAAFVTGCGWLTEERSARLARESTERVAVALAAGGDDSDAPAIVECLRENGRLTPGVILRSLLSGEPALAEAAFATLSELPSRRVRALLWDRGGSGLKALYRKAAMPGALLPAFAAAVAALKRGGYRAGAGASGIDRALLSEVLIACDGLEGAESHALMALLRRLDAEAAREEARGLADSLADDAALALLVEADPQFLIELELGELRDAA